MDTKYIVKIRKMFYEFHTNSGCYNIKFLNRIDKKMRKFEMKGLLSYADFVALQKEISKCYSEFRG